MTCWPGSTARPIRWSGSVGWARVFQDLGLQRLALRAGSIGKDSRLAELGELRRTLARAGCRARVPLHPGRGQLPVRGRPGRLQPATQRVRPTGGRSPHTLRSRQSRPHRPRAVERRELHPAGPDQPPLDAPGARRRCANAAGRPANRRDGPGRRAAPRLGDRSRGGRADASATTIDTPKSSRGVARLRANSTALATQTKLNATWQRPTLSDARA